MEKKATRVEETHRLMLSHFQQKIVDGYVEVYEISER